MLCSFLSSPQCFCYVLLHHCWKIGFATIGGTMLAGIAIISILAGIKNLNANLLQGDLLTNMSIIYEKPYCRINTYFIGILLGFVLYKVEGEV